MLMYQAYYKDTDGRILGLPEIIHCNDDETAIFAPHLFPDWHHHHSDRCHVDVLRIWGGLHGLSFCHQGRKLSERRRLMPDRRLSAGQTMDAVGGSSMGDNDSTKSNTMAIV
jgi:hypothetical protein